MSFLGSLFQAAAPIVGGFFGGPVGAAIGSSIGGVVNQASQANQIQRAQAAQMAAFSPSFGGAPITLNGMPPPVPVAQGVPGFPMPQQNVLPSAGGACPTGWHMDKRTRSRCVRNRRMNPLNGRAASRAIRRIKGARKMLQKIERSLPRAKARAVPRHGHRVHVHSDT